MQLASEVTEALGWHYNDVVWFPAQAGISTWENIIEQAQTEGPRVRLARAAIALECGTDTPVDKLTAAKRLATAHKIAVIFYTMIKNQVEYDETIWDARAAQREKRLEAKLKRQAKQLGFELVPVELKAA